MQSQDMIQTTLIEQTGNRIAKGETDFVDLESVELELALDLQTLHEAGFDECLREAAAACDFDFLFPLPAFDSVPGQRIAVVSTGARGKLLFAVLNKAGTDIEIVPDAAMIPEIRSFASAFTDVFSQLGNAG